MITLLLATRNAHKVSEIRAILGTSVNYISLKDYPDAPDVIEDSTTFAGNATKKAVALSHWIASVRKTETETKDHSLFVLADDSGLEVDALSGAPGVHSARFAGLEKGLAGNSPDLENNKKLLRLLRDIPLEKRTARFRCVLALTPVIKQSRPAASPVCYADELELATELFAGACEGFIALAPSGQGGFGYDSLFVPTGYEISFAEMSGDAKNAISHRSRALSSLKHRLIK